MSPPDMPSGGEPRLPPEIPAEYAEAYRRGYERAWATSHGAPAPEFEDTQFEYTQFEDPFDDLEPATWDGPTHREQGKPSEPRWFVALLIGFVVLALVISAYGLGRLFSYDPEAATETTTTPPVRPEPTPRSPLQPTNREPSPPPAGSRWDGEVAMLTDLDAESGCVMPSGTDAAGRVVDYAPDRAVDGDYTTAWRCAGDGTGVTLDLAWDEPVRLGQVGLVPGYAKTDPQSGADRYAENNRLTRVRWSFGDGTSVVQKLDGSPLRRTVQTMRIPPVRTDAVVIELLASTPGPRRAIAISEIALGETIG